ncbi:MAG TPA: hypothetical protein VGA55_03445 [Bacteroidota bacterium]
MRKVLFPCLLCLCMVGIVRTQAQKPAQFSRSAREDEIITVVLDKTNYFPGDTVRLMIKRGDSTLTTSVTPLVVMGGMEFAPAGHDSHIAVIPNSIAPGSYRILVNIAEINGRQTIRETERSLEVEERQVVEQISKFVSFTPLDGGSELQTAVTLDREQIRALQVVFSRDSIGYQMGPQFVSIKTSVHLRDGTVMQSFERRVVTFRSYGGQEKDRAMFIQYRTAYGPYAAISAAELQRVLLPFDSLPPWSIIKVRVEPDYTIRIGAYDRSNSVTQYFRVRGPAIEVGFSLGIPKVLYDTRAVDTVNYGNTSAMVRFYSVGLESGNRFPVSLGMGTFGVDSPIDVGVGRGGFAVSMFLDVVELMRSFDIEFMRNINAGMELTSFFSIGKRARLLINAQMSLAI